MPKVLNLLTLSTGLLCTAVAMSLQEEPTAEKAFKNIQSFKGEKASAVLPAMQLMSATLKVDCTFCHTEDYASDEKEEKRVTREMIAMTREINEKHFDGKMEVTCGTCHPGLTHPASLPPSGGLESRPERNPDVKPADVLAKFVEAVGNGASAKEAWRLTGEGKFYGEEVKIEALVSAGRFAATSTGPQGVIRFGFDGATAWWSPSTGTIPIPKEVAAKFVRESMPLIGIEALPKFASPGGGTTKIEGKEVVTVSGMVSGETGRATLFFDKGTGLLVRALFLYPTVLGNNVQVSDYADYRSVDGAKLPMSFVNRSAEKETFFQFKSAKREPLTDATAFQPPR